MTLFAAALRLIGLSHADAAEFFGVRLDTVKSWSAGRNKPPTGAWSEMRALYSKQQSAAAEARDLIDEAQPDELFLNVAGPRKSDWPSDGAHMAALATVALSVDLPIAESLSL